MKPALVSMGARGGCAIGKALFHTDEFLRERRTIYERISCEESDENLAS